MMEPGRWRGAAVSKDDQRKTERWEVVNTLLWRRGKIVRPTRWSETGTET
jgi:hypothetical protein